MLWPTPDLHARRNRRRVIPFVPGGWWGGTGRACAPFPVLTHLRPGGCSSLGTASSHCHLSGMTRAIMLLRHQHNVVALIKGGRPMNSIFQRSNPAIEKIFADAGSPKKVTQETGTPQQTKRDSKRKRDQKSPCMSYRPHALGRYDPTFALPQMSRSSGCFLIHRMFRMKHQPRQVASIAAMSIFLKHFSVLE
jgi:hypothetical protein